MREPLKRQLARAARGTPEGLTALIYHSIEGGSPDERDISAASFKAQLQVLAGHNVVSLDAGLDFLAAGDRRPTVVLSFDDGFTGVHAHAWPLLRDRSLPFTVFLATGYVGATMQWAGSTAKNPGHGLAWEHLEEMTGSGLCTVGNHTHTHARPEELNADELDRCSDEVEKHLGVEARPRHFAYTWGIEVPAMRAALATRFRSAATGRLGRNLPGCDLLALRRVPVRRSDPIEFFAAKVGGSLLPERAYDLAVKAAKRLGARA